MSPLPHSLRLTHRQPGPPADPRRSPAARALFVLIAPQQTAVKLRLRTREDGAGEELVQPALERAFSRPPSVRMYGGMCTNALLTRVFNRVVTRYFANGVRARFDHIWHV